MKQKKEVEKKANDPKSQPKKETVNSVSKSQTTSQNEKVEKAKELPSIEELKKMLSEQLSNISKKKKLADNREIFLKKRESLKETQTMLWENKKAGNFEQKSCRISFQVEADYRKEEMFGISNVDLLIFFVESLLTKIDEKIAQIELELIL